MTLPGNGFSAHDGSTVFSCQRPELLDRRFAFPGSHIISIGPETVDTPEVIRQIRVRSTTASTEVFHVLVTDVDLTSRPLQLASFEMWVSSGTRETPYIDQQIDSILFKQSEKIFETPVGVPDGMEDLLLHQSKLNLFYDFEQSIESIDLISSVAGDFTNNSC